ncbi:MAG: hypothetical protein IKI50_08255 [Clostridia bacterium]|nr:hypothetical protein [Clostridia bacterium]
MKKAAALLLCAVLLTGAVSCGPGGPSSSPESQQTTVTPTTVNLIDADITAYLTAAEASEVLGVTMTADAPLEYGTQLRMSDERGAVTLDLALREGTEEDLLAIAAGWEDAPNLGRTARWDPEGGELLIDCGDGHLLSIVLTLPDTQAKNALVYSRELADKILSRLL